MKKIKPPRYSDSPPSWDFWFGKMKVKVPDMKRRIRLALKIDELDKEQLRDYFADFRRIDEANNVWAREEWRRHRKMVREDVASKEAWEKKRSPKIRFENRHKRNRPAFLAECKIYAPWSWERQRRSRVDWFERYPRHIATNQEHWERRQTMLHLYQSGATFVEIGEMFETSEQNVKNAIAKHFGKLQCNVVSPVEREQKDDAEMKALRDVVMETARRDKKAQEYERIKRSVKEQGIYA